MRISFANKCKSAVKKYAALSVVAKITLTFFFIFFVIQAVLHLFPLFWVVNNSLKSTDEFYESSMALTQSWRFQNYINVFSEFKVKGNNGYGIMLFNSLWTTCLYLFVNVGSSALLAYGLARFNFPGRDFLYGIIIFIQTIPILAGGAADFKLRAALGMVNNPALLWISWAMGFDYTCFILYGSFQAISKSYSEAAEIDGATQLQVLLQVMLPQVFPAIIAMLVTNFTGRWNDYTTFQIYLSNYPNLAYGLYLFETTANWATDAKGLYFAALVLSALPAIILYTCFQNLIIKNISVGGLKG